MGRIKQKGKAGAAKAYITRTAAVKKLQISLADFRRLCILKGIYPREPRSRKKANKNNSAPTSFYYSKDISYLAHEPILRKLREHKAFAKKLSRALGRGDLSLAQSLEKQKPVYKLDHIIKERYPTFLDALRDIDDALSLVSLFSTLPSTSAQAKTQISPDLISNVTRLYNEWQLYIINTRSLRKVFLSIKGVYYQAVVQGETITWIEPWKFTQVVPSDVDVRVMLTFLELYQTLLGFTFFKLYTDEGWVYPPPLDEGKEDQGAGVGALSLIDKAAKSANAGEKNDAMKTTSNVSKKDVQQAIKEISSTLPSDPSTSNIAPASSMEIDDEEFVSHPSSTDPNNVTSLPTYQSIAAAGGAERPKLFEGLNFYLSRETPRGLLEFTLRSFGGKVGWDSTVGGGSPYDDAYEGITHVIIDRPAVSPAQPSNTNSSGASASKEGPHASKRKFVQPQWVIDSINAGQLLSEDKYERGKVLLPHLSPFGEGEGRYDPKKYYTSGGDVSMVDADESREGAAKDEDEDESSSEEEIIEGEELPDEEDEESEEEPTPKSKKRKAEDDSKEGKAAKKAKSLSTKIDSAEALRAAELEAEAAGMDFGEWQDAVRRSKKSKTGAKGGEDVKERKVVEDEKEMNKMMMSNKQRKLYEKMKFSERKREAENALLEQRRLDIEKKKRKEAKKAGKA